MPDYRREIVDVCIVGSGAGGAPLALRLAEAGAKVVVLEKGPWYTKADFTRDEIEIVRRDFWVPYVDDEPHLMVTDAAPQPAKTNFGWTANCVGGGTVHMSGYFYRLHPEDFRLRKRYGKLPGANLVDWPITYDDLAPFYAEVEREVGVSGRSGQYPNEPPRPDGEDYPFPPLVPNPLSRLVDDGAKKVGAHPFDTPRAIQSRARNGRAACTYCDFCGSYGCLVDAKGSTMAAILPRAVETGRCEVRPESMVTEVIAGSDGRAAGVRYRDADGKEHRQRARVVVVSATSVESARLLLNSVSGRHPKGIGNANGLVGRHLTFSTLAKGYASWERDQVPAPLRQPHPSHFLQRSIQDWYFLGAEGSSGHDKAGTIHYQLPHRNPIYQADRLARRGPLPLWGAELKKQIHRYWNDVVEIEFETFGEFLPNDGTFVSVGGAKDKFGLPVAEIHLRQLPDDTRNAAALMDKAFSVLEAAGATDKGVEEVGGVTSVLQHGTCRFGKDPATSVLDPSCRSHEVDNLYVVDGSFMPTSGGVASTFTIMANSFRVGKILADRFRRGEIARG